MYSIVMMTALTAAPDAPQFNGYFRDLFSRSNSNGCTGGTGCSGAARYNCSGAMAYAASCSGCSGSMASPASCSGCSGSSCNGGVFGWHLGDRVRSWFERDNSGCCGARSYGCTGASYACSGYSCSGFAYSCFGSYPPMGNGGLPFNVPPPGYDTFPGTPGFPGNPTIPYAVPDPAPGVSGLRPAGHTGALASNGATGRAAVVVKLPADARLFADARQLTMTGSERKFVSPELPTNQEFTYRFKAEYERDGETVSVTKKVTVRAGQTVTVEFVDLTAARPGNPAGTPTGTTKPPVVPTVEPARVEPTSKPTIDAPATPGGDRATITVKLPPGATLYVDDRKSPSQDPVRSFATPPLPAGREYAYVIKAELIRNGQPETLTQKVPFRAGERVVVDFTSLGK